LQEQAESSREQQRAAENSREQQRAAESSREQQRAAESSREQQRTAENSRERQRAAESSREQQRTAESRGCTSNKKEGTSETSGRGGVPKKEPAVPFQLDVLAQGCLWQGLLAFVQPRHCGRMEPSYTQPLSLVECLAPLPLAAFAPMWKVLQLVPKSLGMPFLCAEIATVTGIAVTERAVKNVMHKLEHFLGLPLPRAPAPESLGPELKQLQAKSPLSATCLVSSSRTSCPQCASQLKPAPARQHHSIHMPESFKGSAAEAEGRFVLYTMNAGVQPCGFQESFCPKCKIENDDGANRHCHKYFLGGWQYIKGKAMFGHMNGCRWVGAGGKNDVFVVPHMRALYAVDKSLLQFISDHLVQGAGNFSSAVKVWMGQHPEPVQKDWVAGPDFTLLRHTTQRLADAWFCWRATTLANGMDSKLLWDFASATSLEDSLAQYPPLLRSAHVLKTVAHISSCPVCLRRPGYVVDGKVARRRICANMEGFWEIPEWGVSVQSGCQKHASSRNLYCGICKPQLPVAPIPQVQVLEQRVKLIPGQPKCLEYLVRCHAMDAPEDLFECYLPRTEVMPELLVAFERARGCTRKRKAHPGNGSAQSSHGKPAKNVRVARMQLRGGHLKVAPEPSTGPGVKRKLGRRLPAPCRPPAKTPKQLRKEQRRQPRPGAGCSSSGPTAPTTNAQGWLTVHEEDLAASKCKVDKMKKQSAVRRTSGGMATAVLPCGLLLDWLELWVGESLQLIYVLVARAYSAMESGGCPPSVVFYDNACKLLALVRAKAHLHPPLTEALAMIRFLLDGLHRDNHTWCLQNLPEVDPEREENLHFREDFNTQAAEEYNSWINERTLAAAEMTGAHYNIYWWSLFNDHNTWLEQQASAFRRRYARGHMANDPDRPRHRTRQSLRSSGAFSPGMAAGQPPATR
jgi:hypothetical protein